MLPFRWRALTVAAAVALSGPHATQVLWNFFSAHPRAVGPESRNR